VPDSPGRILVVEDNAATARTVRVFLEAQGYVVRAVAGGRDAIATFREGEVDLVLLDLMLPDIDGLAVCRHIRTTSRVPIVMLTARTADDDIVEGLEAGADDYVTKPFGSRPLLARIRRCLDRVREPLLPSATIRHGDLHLDPERRVVERAGVAIRLTRREFDILLCLMRRPGRVFTRSQIIAAALGPDFDGFDRTVDTHVWSLRRKLSGQPGSSRLIHAEPGVGYRFADPE
jgi:DNA-binding response OmpR family regulator